MKSGYKWIEGWTALEAMIWCSALIITITLVILVIANVVGAWALIFTNAMALAIASLRHRAVTKRQRGKH